MAPPGNTNTDTNANTGTSASGTGLPHFLQGLKFQKPPLLTMVGIGLAALGLLFQLIGLATPAWLVIEMPTGFGRKRRSALYGAAGDGGLYGAGSINLPGTSKITISLGLWSVCTNPGVCSSSTGDDSNMGGEWLHACRLFAILGLFGMMGLFGAALLLCFKQHEKLPLIATALAFGSAAGILLEFVIFAAKAEGSDNYGYSFVLTVLAFLLALGAGVTLGYPIFLKRCQQG